MYKINNYKKLQILCFVLHFVLPLRLKQDIKKDLARII